jgi:hypothetical protein
MRIVMALSAMVFALTISDASVSDISAATKAEQTNAKQNSKQKKPPEAAFARNEHLLAWMNSYRQNPEPQRLAEAVRSMVGTGAVKDLDQAGVYVGFVAGVIGSNPDNAERLVASLFPLDPHDQVIVIRAIAYSGLPDWQQLLGKFVERMPARRVLIERYMFGKKPTLSDLPFEDNTQAIDINWGYYFATGSDEPLRRILSALAWSLDRDDVEKLTIGSMAKWTLAQNASNDMDLLLALKRLAGEQQPGVRVALHEVIEAAETLELGKIRKQAMLTIEELRAKGPETSRNYNKWGQAGQTVLALGCVAAGALGQVQFGIPCVIGGALSNAALKYLAPGTP